MATKKTVARQKSAILKKTKSLISKGKAKKKAGGSSAGARKALSAKTTEMAAKAKGLFKSGRERLQDVDLKPIWQRVKRGLDETGQAIGKGSAAVKERMGGASDAMQKGSATMKKGIVSAVDAVGRGAEKATEKALALAKRAGVQYKIHEQNRKLQALLSELGGRVYDVTKRNPQALSASDPEIMKLVGKIREAEKDLLALEERSGSLKK